MQMKSAISIMLAVWLGFGVGVLPRFLCLCADGTQTLEVGNRFCCDEIDSDIDQCPEMSDLSCESEMCDHDGCEATPLPADVFVLFDRDGDDLADPPAISNQIDYGVFFTQTTLTPPNSPSLLWLKCPPDTELSQIRSTILRV
ncbi:MAG: hypothetical protein ACPG4Q_11000 [Phycisphaeraceae bacterium]